MNPSSSRRPSAAELHAFQTATRDLIGVALHSLEDVDRDVSLPQMRLLLNLQDVGTVSCGRLAERLGLSASSVTRMADRLVASGHIERGSDPDSRSVVTLTLAQHGQEVVQSVLRWRERELRRILSRIDPDLRATTAAGLQALHEVVGATYATDVHGPVPL